MTALYEKLDTLLSPIHPENPAGEDLSYSALFDQIREARRSDDPSLDMGEWEQARKNSEWNKVIQLAEEALSRQSKDLQLLVWYVEALTQVHGLAGATFGLDLLSHWLEQYWESGYPAHDPNDLDERISKLEWLNRQMEDALLGIPLTRPEHGGYSWRHWQESREVENLALKDAAARDAAIAEGKLAGDVFDKSTLVSGPSWFTELAMEATKTRAAYERLDQVVNDRFGGQAPGLGNLREALDSVHHLAQRLLQQCGGCAAPSAAAQLSLAETAASRASQMPATHTSAGPAQNRAEAILMLEQAARYFRSHEPHSPVALLAERAARWAQMSFEEWMQHVIKDDSTLRQLQELLDIRSLRTED